MKNYDAYRSNHFDTTEEEVQKMKARKSLHHDGFYDRDLEYLRKNRGYGETLIRFEVYEIPSHMRRSRYDNAKLLVLYSDKKVVAKRFNNSQHFSLHV